MVHLGVESYLVSLAFILGRSNSRFWEGVRTESFCYFLNCFFVELDSGSPALALGLHKV